MSAQDYYTKIDNATCFLQTKISTKPKALVICGSGLGGIANILKDTTEIPYHEIPGFKVSTVPGHAGKLVFGAIGDNKVPVMCMVGRLHFYEGYDLKDTTLPVRVAKQLGLEIVIVTNAAGGVNAKFQPGDLMLINDHINFPGLAGFHPLKGPNLDTFGPRFQPLSDAYDLELRKLFYTQAKKVLKLDRVIHEGVYFFASGPTFESRAEVRAIRTMGGDAVGMSTVPEVIVARHSGMRVLALSLITNAGVSAPPATVLDDDLPALDEGMASHDEVLENANKAALDVQKIFETTINELA